MTTQERIKKIAALEKKNDQLNSEINLYKTIVNNLPQGIQVFDTNGLSFSVNEKQKELLGLPDLNKGIGKFNVLSDPYAVKTGASKTYEKVYKGQPYHHQFEYDLTIDENKWNTRKEKRSFDETIFPVKGKNGEVEFVVSMLVDITEKQHHKNEITAHEARFTACSTTTMPQCLSLTRNQKILLK